MQEQSRTVQLNESASDYWQQASKLEWGKYIFRIESNAIDIAMEEFKQPGTALDIGAELGRWTRVLLDGGWQVTCTEICEAKVARCQTCNPEAVCRLVSPDEPRLHVADCSTDLVVSIEVPVSGGPGFVGELKRVLRPGGVAVFTLNNQSSYRAVVANAKYRLRGEEPYYVCKYGDVRNQLFKSGFSILHEVGFCWLPFSRFSNSRLIPFLTPLENLLGLSRLVRSSPWVVVVCRKAIR